MAQTTETAPTIVERIAEAKSIKSERDRKARELAAQYEAEAAERARIRAEKIAGGLLGICPACKREADTAEGTVLKHRRLEPFNERDCEGIGEEMLPVAYIEARKGR